MHVHFRRFQLVVPQQLFHDFQVRALLDQMRGERVPQQVEYTRQSKQQRTGID